MAAILIFRSSRIPYSHRKCNQRSPFYTARVERSSRAPQGASYDQNREGQILQRGTDAVGSY